MLKQHGQKHGDSSAIAALIQIHLYMKYIHMRIFVSMYIRQPDIFTVYLCTCIFFKSSVSIAVSVL